MIPSRRQNKAWTILAAACASLLVGCVSPQKIQKARTDFSTYSAERNEREIEQRCADAGALPGTEASLECRLGLSKPPPNPPAH